MGQCSVSSKQLRFAHCSVMLVACRRVPQVPGFGANASRSRFTFGLSCDVAAGGGVQVRPHSTSAQLCAFTRTNRPVVRSVASALAAAVVSNTTDEESSIPPSTEHAAPQPVAAAPDAETTAPSRRRRRSVTISSSAGAPPPPPEAAAPPSTKQTKASKQQQKTRSYQAPDLHQLFTQDPEASASRVRRVSRQQPAVLPAGAEQDATKVAAANRRAAAAAKAQAQLEQQIDPQVLAAFRPFAESFQEAAKSAGPAHSKAADLQETHADAGRSRQQQTQQQQQQQQLPQQPSQQVQPKQRAKNKRDFIELFSPKLQLGVQPPQVSRCAATHTCLHTGYTCSYETQKAHANHSLVTPLCFGVLCWFVVGLMERPLQPVCAYLLYKP